MYRTFHSVHKFTLFLVEKEKGLGQKRKKKGGGQKKKKRYKRDREGLR